MCVSYLGFYLAYLFNTLTNLGKAESVKEHGIILKKAGM